MEYKKIDISLKDRFVLLFTGLIPKKYIETGKPNITFSQTKQEEKTDINNIEDNTMKMDSIPFFDLDQSDTKSNL
jgi:hypothetical protein